MAILFLMIVNSISAQFSDNFSDGNLTDNPTWEGDIQNFQFNAGELQLDAPVSTTGNIAIFTPTNLPDSAVWEIYTRLEFPPSDANRLDIFLQVDNKNIAEANGYLLKIGKTGGNDNLEFFRLDNGTEELLASGITGAVANAPEVRIRTTREIDGTWTIATDYSGGQNFSPEIQILDTTYPSGTAWFGLNCEYTSSRIDLFFFDDISAQPLVPDTQSPVLLSAKAVNETTLEVIFDEELETASAENPLNYAISPTLGNPISANQKPGQPNEVTLTFSNTLENQSYTLTTENIADLLGNRSGTQTTNFDFFQAERPDRYDLIINEIMVDPTPLVGLPDAEWVEIYNRSDKTFSLENMAFSDSGSDKFLPDVTLFPGEFAIICAADVETEFAPFGKTVPISSFPVLTNGGESISLKDQSGNTLHTVEYDDSWYGETSKNDGGWTLELINPQTPCVGAENWIASQNLNGGTPGRVNSVLDESPDETFPDLLEVFPESTTKLLLTFSEGLDFLKAADVSAFQISPALSVQTATPLSPLFDKVLLSLNEPIEANQRYNIRIESTVEDCSGNPVGMMDNLDFALPLPIEEGDLIINEILFNPNSGSADFLEIQNISGKILNVGDLLIGNVKDGDTEVVGVTKRQLLFPGDFAVFTENRQSVLSEYTVPNPSLVIENDLPSFLNEEGNAKLFIPGLLSPQLIDDLNYDEDWHNPLLDNQKGVSLERIDPLAPTDDRNNWNSAAESVGWATPTGINSQNKNTATAVENFFTLNPKTFTPNDDGLEDFLLINYELGESGFVANTTIFDASGRPVKLLSQNELLATEGFLRWDGDTDFGEPAKSGIYIIYIQMFNNQGTVQEFKLPCVLERGL